MDVRVLEGRLLEAPNAAVTGLDRRAFGEFVSHRGEPAHYAIGWTTGTPHRTARMTVALDAGTFHAAITPHDDGGHAFALTGTPFERFPAAGPDLTAEAARHHPALPFVWSVADHVMQRDRRARWMRHWLIETTSVQTTEVFEHREPILLVSHEDYDDVWQLIGATSAADSAARVGFLHQAVDEDPTLIDVLDLSPGEAAERTAVGDPWRRFRG